MGYPVYYVPAGDVLPVFFDTFDGGTGASITMTGLAVTDIEIYKDGGATQRASDAGYTLLDTDGIDFDTITGIHGFSIDTGDNTDAGFYTTGSWFHVVVSSVTIDAQTVNFVACAFRIMAAEGAAGVPTVNLTHVAGSTSDVSALATNVAAILVDTADMQPKLGTPAGASVSADIAAVKSDTAAILTDTAEIGAAGAGLTALATAAALATVDANVDTLVLGIITGAAVTGTLSTTQASTNLTGYANDQLIGRVVIWTSGACDGEATDITDYVETNGVLTFTALTTAPGNGDTFKIV